MSNLTVKMLQSLSTSGHRSRPETQIMLDVTNEFERGFSQMTSKFRSQISSILRRNRIPNDYQAYFYFILIESQDNWPSMSQDQKASLKAVVRLLSTSGSLPNYRGSIEVPDHDIEKQINKSIKSLGSWAHSTFRSKMKSNYNKAVKRKVSDVKRIRKEDRLSDSVAFRFIDGLVKKWGIRDHPMWFSNPSRLRMILNLF